MNLIINRKATVKLEGNQMSGETYPVKGYIHDYLGGKWNADSKTWTVDTAKVESLIAKGCIYVTETAPVAKDTVTRNGWCNKCHSYCYGDCDSH